MNWTTVWRSCVTDEGRSLETGFQEQASNHPQAAAVKSRGGERWGKSASTDLRRCVCERRTKVNPSKTGR